MPTPDNLARWLAASGIDKETEPSIAVGFSGGPDSTALLWLLSRLHDRGQCPAIFAVTVDHDLRAGSDEEAACVGAAVTGWSGVTHHILRRPAPTESGRVMERARRDRYRLLAEFCQERAVRSLFVAHHRDDQAETVLFRLAKGSGIDGLAGMRPVTRLPSGVRLCRPLLGCSKQSLIDLCQAQGLAFVEDPSNSNDRFARPRLRAAIQALEREGLTTERLSCVANRLQKSSQALQFIAEKVSKQAEIITDTNRIVLKYSALRDWPDDIRYRVLRNCCIELSEANGAGDDYGPRMQPLERIATDLFSEPPVRRATLAGCLFTLRLKDDTLEIVREKPPASCSPSGNACSEPQKA